VTLRHSAELTAARAHFLAGDLGRAAARQRQPDEAAELVRPSASAINPDTAAAMYSHFAGRRGAIDSRASGFTSTETGGVSEF